MSIVETYHGYIETTQDTLIIFEACRRGLLPRICRRLQEKERRIVRSGSVFVFDERESGIKRWTDGLVWSPSRILGNFLIYRELDKRNSGKKSTSPFDRALNSSDVESAAETNKDRAIIGSLTNSYRFKKNGLIKKTMSIVVNGISQHMISYYSKEDVLANKLCTPSSVAEIACLEISPEFLMKQNFRIPPTVDQTFEQYNTHTPASNHSPRTPGSALEYTVDGNRSEFPSNFEQYHVRPRIEQDSQGAPQDMTPKSHHYQPIHSHQGHHAETSLPGGLQQNHYDHYHYHHHHNGSTSSNDFNSYNGSNNSNSHSHSYSSSGALDTPPLSFRHSPRSHAFIPYSSHPSPQSSASQQQGHSKSRKRQSISSPYGNESPTLAVPNSDTNNSNSQNNVGFSMSYHSPNPSGNSVELNRHPSSQQPQQQSQHQYHPVSQGWNEIHYSVQ